MAMLTTYWCLLHDHHTSGQNCLAPTLCPNYIINHLYVHPIVEQNAFNNYGQYFSTLSLSIWSVNHILCKPFNSCGGASKFTVLCAYYSITTSLHVGHADAMFHTQFKHIQILQYNFWPVNCDPAILLSMCSCPKI